MVSSNEAEKRVASTQTDLSTKSEDILSEYDEREGPLLRDSGLDDFKEKLLEAKIREAR